MEGGKPLAEWSDVDIRRALLAHGESSEVPITPTTRPLLLRKLARLQEQPAVSRTREGGSGRESCSESQNCSSHQAGHPQENPIEGYYGVVGRGPQSYLELSPFYTSKSEVLRAVKGVPGARFKRFDSQHGAEAFSRQHMSVEEDSLDSQGQRNTTTSEKANSFPRPKVQDLSSLRKLIETGTVDDFARTVWSNPLTLINSGDAPAILQEGCHYNALHCAARTGRLDMCQKLLEVIQSNHFWELVYPGDSEPIRAERKSRLIDLYLNIQDKINNETPLHFASKLGHEEIVAFLTSFPQTSTSIRNRYGETPGDVVGRNAKTSTGLKERITELLQAPESYFVPVLRAVDNSTPPRLGTPCTWEDYLQQEELLTDNSGTPIVGQAFAGPMSPSKAKEIYQEWKSPRGRRACSLMKRSDPTKGWERVGRSIACWNKIGWTEYWDFLGCYCDLSKRGGLQKLEDHLASQASPSWYPGSPTFTGQIEGEERPLCRAEVSPRRLCDKDDSALTRELFPREGNGLAEAGTGTEAETGTESGTGTVSETGTESGTGTEAGTGAVAGTGTVAETGTESGTGRVSETGTEAGCHSKPNPCSNLDLPDSAVSNLAESLASLDLYDRDTEATNYGPVDRPTPGFITPVKGSSTLTTKDSLFLTGPQPTKVDYDALLAVSESDIDRQCHPHIHIWLNLVKSYTEQEQKSWRTPHSDRRQHHFRINHSFPVSPRALVLSPPPPSPQHTPILHRSHTSKRHHTHILK